jgi:hypothetical protein
MTFWLRTEAVRAINRPLSDEWTDYHLTERGWEEGSLKSDGEGVTHVDLPDDRVLTIRRHERQGSPYSQMQVWSETEWESDDKKRLKELLAQFGSRPAGD